MKVKLFSTVAFHAPSLINCLGTNLLICFAYLGKASCCIVRMYEAMGMNWVGGMLIFDITFLANSIQPSLRSVDT